MVKAPPRIGARPPQAERERKQKLDRRRLSPSQRGYDAAWQRVRDAVILERGLRCEACGRLGALGKRGATPSLPVLNVDHIKTVAERPDLRLNPCREMPAKARAMLALTDVSAAFLDGHSGI